MRTMSLALGNFEHEAEYLIQFQRSRTIVGLLGYIYFVLEDLRRIRVLRKPWVIKAGKATFIRHIIFAFRWVPNIDISSDRCFNRDSYGTAGLKAGLYFVAVGETVYAG